jgi:hypothetical protein
MPLPWPPLASSPRAFTGFASAVGVDMSQLEFLDVLGLDDDAIACLPPLLAAILVYPTTPAAQTYLLSLEDRPTDPVFRLKQLLGGMCGTIAALHALTNLPDELRSEISTPLRRRLDGGPGHHDSKALEVSELSEFERCDQQSRAVLSSTSVREAHMRCASSSATAAAPAGERQGRHYLTLIRSGEAGSEALLVLDGRRDGVLSGGGTTAATFSRDAAAWVRALLRSTIQAEAEQGVVVDHSFSMLALVRRTHT